MTRRYLLSILLLAGVLAGGPAIAGWDPPAFSEYPVKKVFTGKPVKPLLKKGALGWNLRTRIREQAKDGPNFAGEWTLVSIGAGTGVQVNLLVNARTGRVVQAPQSQLGVIVRLNSRLLVVNEPELADEHNKSLEGDALFSSAIAPEYYAWENGKFVWAEGH